jgi:nitrogen-specific signal transduction histidine kinase
VVLRDVTERRQAERERLEMERRLLQSQKTESIGVLAGGIAHDYNNLLTVIQGGLELTLLDLPPDSELRTPLERAVRAADRAAVLTRQILDYSGRGRTVLTDVDLSGIVADKVPLLRASIAKTIELDLQLAAGLPRVRADAAQVQQLVVNLVINAAEAIGERVGTIIVSSGVCTCDAAQLSASRTPAAPAPGRFAFLSVTDNGGGMSDEIQGRAFDPFFTTKSTGRGLGLSSVLGIVHGCGGAVFLDSLPARGTAVRALFPLEERPDAVVAAPAEPPAAPASRPPALRGRGRLLLVDDEDMVRDVCQSMLARMGFEVLTAADGMEAVEIYRRHAAEIDGVVLDYAMPRMDGLATLRAMAGIRADVRAILSSGYTEEEATRRFNDAGLAGFIQKPYQFEKLRAAVLGVLGSTTGG